MTTDDSKRKMLILVGGTLGVAIAILLLLSQIGKSPTATKTTQNTTDGLPDINTGLQPPALDENYDPTQVDDLIKSREATGTEIELVNFNIEVPKKDGSGRTAFRFRGETNRPLPNRRHRIPKPQIWVYLSEDEVAYTTADVVEILGTTENPDEGFLEGNVQIQIFKRLDPTSNIEELDVHSATPVVEFEADRLDFVRAPFKVSTDSEFIIRSPEYALAARGMHIRYNESEDRIEFLRIEERRIIVYRPTATTPDPLVDTNAIDANSLATSAGQPHPTTNSSPTAEEQDIIDSSPLGNNGLNKMMPATATLAEAITTDFYRVVLDEGVRIMRGTDADAISIEGDSLAAEFHSGSNDLSSMMRQAMRPSFHDLPATSKLAQNTEQTFVPRHNDIMPRTTSTTMKYYRRHSHHRIPSITSRRATFAPLLYAAVATLVTLDGRAIGQDPPLDTTSQSVWSFDISPEDIPTLIGAENNDVLAQDVRIYGHGSIELRPMESQSNNMQSLEDVAIRLQGSPVVLRSGDQAGRCGVMEYNSVPDVARLMPGKYAKVEFDLGTQEFEQGTATTHQPVLIDLARNTAMFEGEGTLLASSRLMQDGDDANPTGEQPQRTSINSFELGGGVSAQWNESFELRFGSDDTAGDSGMGNIESVEFKGEVRFEHDEGYTLEADRLIARFRYDADLGEPVLSEINGYGHVMAFDGQQGWIEGDAMDVFFEMDGTTPTPVSVEFLGNVYAHDLDNSLRSGYLRAELLKPSEIAEDDPNQDPMKYILATESVRFAIGTATTGDSMADPALVTGDRLEAWPREKRGELTGESVIASQSSVNFISKRVEMEDLGLDENGNQRFRVFGPGGLLTHAKGEIAPANTDRERARNRQQIWQKVREQLDNPTPTITNPLDTEDPNSNQPVASVADVVSIQWQESFELILEQDWQNVLSAVDGTFRGTVVVENSPIQTEFNSIQADRLEYRLIREATPNATVNGQRFVGSFEDPIATVEREAPTQPRSTTGAGDILQDGGGKWALRSMSAFGNGDSPARLQAKRYRTEQRNHTDTVYYIAGPIVEYESALQQIDVTGGGKMFLLDETESEPDTADVKRIPKERKIAGADKAEVEISGQGRTLFEWAGRMRLNGDSQTIAMFDDVHIIHRPLADENATPDQSTNSNLELWCDELQGAMDTSNDPVEPLNMSGSSMNQLRMFNAAGSVFVRTSKHEIGAQRMHFDKTEGMAGMARLEGDAQNPVTMKAHDSPTEFEAERMYWSLYTDTVTVKNPGAITVPQSNLRR